MLRTIQTGLGIVCPVFSVVLSSLLLPFARVGWVGGGGNSKHVRAMLHVLHVRIYCRCSCTCSGHGTAFTYVIPQRASSVSVVVLVVSFCRSFAFCFHATAFADIVPLRGSYIFLSNIFVLLIGCSAILIVAISACHVGVGHRRFRAEGEAPLVPQCVVAGSQCIHEFWQALEKQGLSLPPRLCALVPLATFCRRTR